MNTGRYCISIMVIVCALVSVCFGAQKLKSVAVSGGSLHSLIVVDNNEVFAAGVNTYGALGSGAADGARPVFERVVKGQMSTATGLLENISSVGAGENFSIFLDKSNKLWSVGYNKYGCLGNGKDFQTQNYDPPQEVSPVQVLAGDQGSGQLQNIISTAAGKDSGFSLAADSGGYAYAWGINTAGQCGQGDNGADHYNTPKRVNPLTNIIAVSAGLNQSMALTSGGNVYTWGSNIATGDEGVSHYGKLGINDTSDLYKTTPQLVGSLSNINAISAGKDHCMALQNSTSGGRVYCWGYNGNGVTEDNPPGTYSLAGGRLGDGTTNSASRPVIVKAGEQTGTDLLNIKAIAAGYCHSMALDSNSNVLTWGDNHYGQLGNNSTTASATPVYVKLADGHKLSNITSIAAGYYQSLAADSSGVLYVWGSPVSGKLGLGNYLNYQTITSPVPIQLTYPSVHNKTMSPNKDYYTLGEAATDADDGTFNKIVVDAGTYRENVAIPASKNLTIQSSSPTDPAIVGKTIIDGDGGTAITFSGNADFVLDGLMIRAADTAVIRQYSTTTINRCQISVNGTDKSCIELSSSNADVNSCILNGGKTNSYGVNGYSGGSLTVRNCQIQNCNNYGIYVTSPDSVDIHNNRIFGSRGSNSAGIFLQGYSAVYDNIIYGNTYGIYIDFGYDTTVRNNTIVNNISYGLYFDDYSDPKAVSNCIVWNNNKSGSTYGPQIYYPTGSTTNVTYCDVQQTGFDNTNINSDPIFVSPDTNDFHLRFGSPCIDVRDTTYTPPSEETSDIDGDLRKLDGNADGTKKVDIGADEYWAGDFYKDNTVNFKDFAVLAKAWQANTNNANWNSACDLNYDGVIDWNDVRIFSSFWLTTHGGSGVVAGMEYEDSNDMMQQQSQQGEQSMDSQTQAATVSLFYDGNEPNDGDEVTVYVYTDSPLWLLYVDVSVIGDANITTAMGTADCNQYGWDPSWQIDPYIDEPNGFVEFGGVMFSEEGVGPGNVSYLKFIYHSGQISISIDFGCGLDNYGAYTDFSTEPLLIGRDPNEP